MLFPSLRDKISKHVLKETKNAQSEVLSTTQPFYVSRSEETIIPKRPTILSSHTMHSLTRFRSPETKFLSTFSKKQKNAKSKLLGTTQLFMQAGLKNHLVHSSNNSECNRCELAVVRNLFLTTAALRLDRR